jgi:hypothetical protein
MKLKKMLRGIHPNSTNLFHRRSPLSEICNDIVQAQSMPSGAVHPNTPIYNLAGNEECQRLHKARLALAVSTPKSGDREREIKELLEVSKAAETSQFNSAVLSSGHLRPAWENGSCSRRPACEPGLAPGRLLPTRSRARPQANCWRDGCAGAGCCSGGVRRRHRAPVPTPRS